MTKELKEKFNLIMTYYSDYKENTQKGLKEITLHTGIEIEPKGVIRLDVWIIRNDFLENQDEKEIVFKSQTVFEFTVGLRLTKDELFDMFKYAEQQMLNHQPFIKDGDDTRIRTLYPTGDEILRENMEIVIQDVPEYLESLG